MSKQAWFGPSTLAYLAELRDNNERRWFEANRERYEAHVREPARAFIRAMAPRLKKISSSLVADDRKAGGSLMRVFRDTRFSKDKTPYKTNVGIQFRHAHGKDVHAPGCYLHIGLDECFLGMGMWRPEPAALAKVRERILAEPKKYAKIIADPKLTAVWRQEGESLKRPPQGVAPDHPLVGELKRKDHILVCDLSVDEVESPALVELVTERLAAGKAHMRFLCDALDVPF